jgi:hypothetical protein
MVLQRSPILDGPGNDDIAAPVMRRSVENFGEAKRMYLHYLGSTFYMSRDDRLEPGETVARFNSYGVPPALLEEWKAELTATQLALLDSTGNWRVVNFLVHHGDREHLDDLLATPPRGRLWERCAYLECLLKYVDRCADDRYDDDRRSRASIYEPARLKAALEYVIDEARTLYRVARAPRSIARVDRIIAGAAARLAAARPGD